MPRDLSHWLVEDDNEGDFPLTEDEFDEEGFHNEFNPKEFESYNDDHCYEVLVP